MSSSAEKMRAAIRGSLPTSGGTQVQTTPEFFIYDQATTVSERVEADRR